VSRGQGSGLGSRISGFGRGSCLIERDLAGDTRAGVSGGLDFGFGASGLGFDSKWSEGISPRLLDPPLFNVVTRVPDKKVADLRENDQEGGLDLRVRTRERSSGLGIWFLGLGCG